MRSAQIGTDSHGAAMTQAVWREGLSEQTASRLLRSEGYNELPRARKRTRLSIAIEVASEPMFGLLMAAAAIYLMLGNLGEALVLGGSALVTVAIAIVQESRAERVLESLRDLTSPRALVIRGGVHRRIPGREVVRGDLIVLAEGDRVPADALLTSSNDLEADESLLTGESIPVRKKAGSSPITARLGRDDLAAVFSGTMIVRGQGIAQVTAIGAAAEIGRIGKTLAEIKDEPSPLRAQMRRLVRVVASIGIALSGLTIILYGALRGSWLNGLLAGIALAMSVLPEEFPLVLTIFIVMGAWRISKVRVLTRRAAAIEILGAATVLCVDKTGTLTLNQMAVGALWAIDGAANLTLRPAATIPESLRTVAEFGILACETEPLDAMERAIHACAKQALDCSEWPRTGWALVHEYSLSADLLAMSHVWRAPGTPGFTVAAKGAPEAIIDICGLPQPVLGRVRDAVDDMASRGMRVLGVARARFDESRWPESQRDFAFEFVGLIGLADPLRPTARDVVRECRTAGIRIVMMTGDYPVTARAIGGQAGLDIFAGVVTGDKLSAMTDGELRERLGTVSVFARIMPEQKLRIVEMFKANGEVVAMTGDGVNDAPSLKAANVGIAMGGRGTDVAREAAAIVLLDDELGSIVRAIRLGRRIYDNLRKAMRFLLAVHVPIAGLALMPLLLGWPPILSPVHIAFLELIIDPVSSIVFESEPEEDDIMKRPPRDRRKPLFSAALLGLSIAQGLWVFFLTAAIFGLALHYGTPERAARALTFASLVCADLALVLATRSSRSSLLVALRVPNRALWLVFAATFCLLATTLAVPALREIFRFDAMRLKDLLIVLAAGIATLIVLELAKKISQLLTAAPRIRRADASSPC